MTDTINMAEAYRAGRGVNFRDADGRVMPAELVEGPNDDGDCWWRIMGEHRTKKAGVLRSPGEQRYFKADGRHVLGCDVRLILAEDPRAEAERLCKLAENHPDLFEVLPVLAPKVDPIEARVRECLERKFPHFSPWLITRIVAALRADGLLIEGEG